MNSIVIYYSYSGNTKKVGDVLIEYLRQRSEVEFIELRTLDESDKFFIQVARALRHKRAKLQLVDFDLAKYDLICLGTPVWAFGPAPAINTYLDKCFGLEDKEVILFITYGSGTGKERCLNYMQDILIKKGAKRCKRFSISQFKVSDNDFVLSRIKEALPL